MKAVCLICGEPAENCPICGLPGGFHDSDYKNSKHRDREVPREFLKEPGWHKTKKE